METPIMFVVIIVAAQWKAASRRALHNLSPMRNGLLMDKIEIL
jgi:hypothetical protein